MPGSAPATSIRLICVAPLVWVCVYLPMFGTLGFDYGIGFDKPEYDGSKKLSNFAEFENIILGFEPD